MALKIGSVRRSCRQPDRRPRVEPAPVRCRTTPGRWWRSSRSEAEYQQSLEEIRAAAERAGSGVSELLELARLEAGQATPRLAPLRLDLLAEEVGASIRSDNTVLEALPGEALVVDADYNLLRQVVDTLTRNAVARADHV